LWRYRDLLPVDAEAAVDLGAGCTPLVRAERLGRSSAARAVDQERHGQSDRLVQGSRRLRRAHQGTAARLQGRRLRLHRQPRQRRRRTRRVGGHGLGRARAPGSRAREDPDGLGVRRAGDRRGRYLRRREPPVRRARRRVRHLGLRQREPSAYYAEGSKTLAFEICEQLDWEVPDHVVVPIASGSHSRRSRRASTSSASSASSPARAGSGSPAPRRSGAPRSPLPMPRDPTRSSRCGRTPSRSRSRSGTQPTATTRCRRSPRQAAAARR